MHWREWNKLLLTSHTLCFQWQRLWSIVIIPADIIYDDKKCENHCFFLEASFCYSNCVCVLVNAGYTVNVENNLWTKGCDVIVIMNRCHRSTNWCVRASAVCAHVMCMRVFCPNWWFMRDVESGGVRMWDVELGAITLCQMWWNDARCGVYEMRCNVVRCRDVVVRWA